MIGSRVRLAVAEVEELTMFGTMTLGTVERVDGAVAWVKWDGVRNVVPYLIGRLEVVA